jgi:hypothetical protein
MAQHRAVTTLLLLFFFPPALRDIRSLTILSMESGRLVHREKDSFYRRETCVRRTSHLVVKSRESGS